MNSKSLTFHNFVFFSLAQNTIGAQLQSTAEVRCMYRAKRKMKDNTYTGHNCSASCHLAKDKEVPCVANPRNLFFTHDVLGRNSLAHILP